MIDAALAEAKEPDDFSREHLIPPPQEASALKPVWVDGTLKQSAASPVAVGDRVLLAASLIGIKGEIEQFGVDFEAWIADCFARRNEAPQVTRGPLRQLQALAALIGKEPPPLAALFRILHAREGLKDQIAVVQDQWPDDLAKRFASIVRQFDAPAGLSSEWRRLTRTPDRPSSVDVLAAPEAVEALASSLEKVDDPIIDRPLIDEMREMAGRLRHEVVEAAGPVSEATALRARDLIEGVNNILKRLAEAGIAIYESKLGKRARGEFATGFRVELPIQAKRLGKAFAKVLVWGPVAIAGSALAGYFGWLAPLWRLFAPFLK